MNKAVFLDRDGVINELIYHCEAGIIDSPFTVDQIRLFPDVGKAITLFHDLGYFVVIVSNQPGMAKHHFTSGTFDEMKEKIHQELKKQQATIDAEYYCIHHPEATNETYKSMCTCRKPKPGLLIQAAEEHHIDLKRSWMIGDSLTDIQAGVAASCHTILIGRMKCDLCNRMDDLGVKPDHIAPNLYKASKIIQNQDKKD